MANSVILTTTLAVAADDNGIAESQSPLAAGNLTLNGVLVSSGVAILTTAGIARQVVITSGGNDSDKTFTIYGTNATGNAISEVLTGASGAAATSALYYRTVTRIAISAASAGTVIAGTNGVGVSRIVNIDTALNPINVSITTAVTGTVNYTIQYTTGDIQGSPVWTNDAGGAKTGAFATTYTTPISGVRILINSGTGVVTTNIVQSGLGS